MYSCRNEDILNNEATTHQRNNSDFFKHSKKGGTHAKSGVDYVDILEAYNRETDFISTLPDQEGMPIWEKIQILDVDDKTVLYVPLSSDEASLSSLILVTLNENNEVSVLRDFTNDYLKTYAYNPEYPENKRRFLIDTFLQMDFLTFKQQRFTNLPTDLYKGATEYNQLNILDVTLESMSNGKFIYGSFCATIHACVNGCTLLTCDYNNCQHGGKCKVWKSCVNTVDWVDDPSSYPYNPSCGSGCGGCGGGTPGSGGPRPTDPCAPTGGNKAFYRMMTGCGVNNGGEDETFNPPLIIIDNSLNNSKLKCILEKISGDSQLGDASLTLPNNTANDNFIQKMLRNFNGTNQPTLNFKLAPILSNGEWAITGNIDGSYEITTEQNVEDGSNIMKIVTLSHELIHAYMFNYLQGLGIIYFDGSGEPIIDIVCSNNVNYNNVNLNSLNEKDRFVALFCAMNQNGTLPEWSHEIFNSPNSFGVNSYRTILEQYLNTYDWDSENINFKNEAFSIFGNNWKTELSKAVSWIGLENTADYNNYINNYSSSVSKLTYLSQIRTKIQNLKNTCP
ncbi:MAG: hypothetical protein J6O88_12450 [Chryseobacterium sp.]|uniref:hypothetical protein n=1 Tax=Chryseobacterium sp. TaxID=1871047 RepID=UPI001B2B55C9|nr:hypothetical protein [Chryseobacterium sp.]MBO6185479.1 hypothetical protein [Chryseobacterium sp.]